jgi:long-subunit fatty acid transport protein
LRIRFDNPLQPDSYQTYDWSDAWMISAGASYDVSPEWTLRAGAAIDETPTTDATRDARIPDATRTWLSFSVEHHITPTVMFIRGGKRNKCDSRNDEQRNCCQSVPCANLTAEILHNNGRERLHTCHHLKAESQANIQPKSLRRPVAVARH